MNAEVRQMKTAAELALAEAFTAARPALGKGRVAELREEAFRRFEAAGLPHRRVEEWKYTDLRALMRDAKPLAAPPDAAALARGREAGALLAELGARKLTLVNGALVPELSETADGEISIEPLAKALTSSDHWAFRARETTDDIAVALNTAFAQDGAVIRVRKGERLDRPILIAHAASGEAAASIFTRSVLLVEPGARVMLVETHDDPSGQEDQINNALELVVGDDAHVDYVKIVGRGAGALHLTSLIATVGANARFNAFSFISGGSVVRNQLFVRGTGTDSIINLGGATLARGRQHADTTLVLDHAVSGGTSREVFRAVLDDESRAVFQGKIIVRPDAQKTDAKMMTRALLLSELAEADNKPELEIFADDVQCGHGATAGALDEDLKFYLMARGIPAKEAESLLIQAFIGEAVEGIEHAGLRETLMEIAVDWLRTR